MPMASVREILCANSSRAPILDLQTQRLGHQRRGRLKVQPPTLLGFPWEARCLRRSAEELDCFWSLGALCSCCPFACCISQQPRSTPPGKFHNTRIPSGGLRMETSAELLMPLRRPRMDIFGSAPRVVWCASMGFALYPGQHPQASSFPVARSHHFWVLVTAVSG